MSRLLFSRGSLSLSQLRSSMRHVASNAQRAQHAAFSSLSAASSLGVQRSVASASMGAVAAAAPLSAFALQAAPAALQPLNR